MIFIVGSRQHVFMLLGGTGVPGENPPNSENVRLEKGTLDRLAVPPNVFYRYMYSMYLRKSNKNAFKSDCVSALEFKLKSSLKFLGMAISAELGTALKPCHTREPLKAESTQMRSVLEQRLK